jgi:transposase-like protein
MQNESWQRAIAQSRSWTNEEAAQAIAACEASGLTTAAFARRHGSTGGRFQYWRKRLRAVGAEGDARLLPVKIVEPGQARLVEREPGRVVVVDGRLRVEMAGMPAAWVATLIRLLRESEG